MQTKLGVGNDLQRSYRMQDFASPGVIMRERSFIRPQSHHNMHHNQAKQHTNLADADIVVGEKLVIICASGMFADASIDGFHAVLRKRNASLLSRVRGSANSILNTLSEKPDCSILRHWVHSHVHLSGTSSRQFPNNGKRRSMILTNAKGKPTLEIYRPPGVRTDGVATTTTTTPATTNKLNVHAKEFTMAKHADSHNRPAMSVGYSSVGLQHSRSAVLHAQVPPHYRPVMPANSMLVNSASSGNVHQSGPRVHFKLRPQQAIIPEKKKSPPSSLTNGNGRTIRPLSFTPGGLKRSKSLTSADTLASGMAALGLAADAGDLGTFPPEIQECIDKALEDPNAVTARTLMDAVGHLVSRAVESPRYALPAARRCIAVVEREQTETFLESLLNTCQQWYHDRDKLLGGVVGGGRPRLMAFMSFLLEMYCQLRRRAIQRRGAPAQPGQVLLTLICKCCEDCIQQAVPSPSDTENLFFVLTYIGRDLESQLPGELERLLAAVRDAFLNVAAPPTIRRTLLQLIELHASRWHLPGCAVLYYYPSSK